MAEGECSDPCLGRMEGSKAREGKAREGNGDEVQLH